MLSILLGLTQVMATVPSTDEHFRGQAERGLILMESREGVRCSVKVAQVDAEGYSHSKIGCADGRTGELLLRVDEEGIGIGYGSLEGHALSLTVGP